MDFSDAWLFLQQRACRQRGTGSSGDWQAERDHKQRAWAAKCWHSVIKVSLVRHLITWRTSFPISWEKRWARPWAAQSCTHPEEQPERWSRLWAEAAFCLGAEACSGLVTYLITLWILFSICEMGMATLAFSPAVSFNISRTLRHLILCKWETYQLCLR